MQTYPSKILLLLAVAASQIVGGSSCCCLSQLLASTIDYTLRLAVSSNVQTDEFACPNCCRQRVQARTIDAKAFVSTQAKRTDIVLSNGKCNCRNHPTICVSDGKPKVNSLDRREHILQQIPPALDEFGWSIAIGKKAKCSYSPPWCHWPVNRAWQCFACIWIV